MIRRLQFEPSAQALTQRAQEDDESACITNECCDHLVQSDGGGQLCLRLSRRHIHAASAPEFYPTISMQLAVTGADRVGMKFEPPRQFAGTGQALAGRQVVA